MIQRLSEVSAVNWPQTGNKFWRSLATPFGRTPAMMAAIVGGAARLLFCRDQNANARHKAGHNAGGHAIDRFTLLRELTLQALDLVLQARVLADQCLDLAHRMQNRGVIAATEAAADFRQRAQG